MLQAKAMEKVVQKYMNAAQVMLPRSEEKAGRGSNTMDLTVDISPRTQSLNAFLTTPNTSLNLYRQSLNRNPMATVAEWLVQVNPAAGNPINSPNSLSVLLMPNVGTSPHPTPVQTSTGSLLLPCHRGGLACLISSTDIIKIVTGV